MSKKKQTKKTSSGTAQGTPAKKRIGEMLISEGYIDLEHVQEALAIQEESGGKMVDILFDRGHLDVDTFARFLATHRAIPSIDLSRYNVPPEVCQLIPREFAERYEVFPIDKIGKLLTVGMAYPLDTDTIEELHQSTGLKVKALLCDPRDIRAAIKQYYAEVAEFEHSSFELFRTRVKLENISRLLEKIDALPTLPQTVQKVKQAVDDPEVSMKEVTGIISYDPPLSAKLLHLANSSMYGLAQHVDSLEMAATLLGLKEIYLAALSSAVIDILKKSRQIDYPKFWRYSTFCAIAAKKIGEQCGMKRTAGVFTAGLLHDIGRFALAEAAPQQYNAVDGGLEGPALVRAEQEIFGIGHPEAGYILARQWQLPTDIADGIRFHHGPPSQSPGDQMSSVLFLGAAMAEVYRLSRDPMVAYLRLERKVLKRLGIDADDLYSIHSDTVDTLQNEVF